jgi:hypothetical protein
MLTVEGIIGDLLLQHNCVIVPAFGGFVTQRVGAQLDAVNGTMTPPRKAILFNRQLINNDGLLVASFAHQNKVEYNQAQSVVSETINRWDNDLRNGQRISIDRVGFLYLDQERNLCFEQDRFYNLLMESYGLGAIHFVSASDVVARASHEVMQEMVKEAMVVPVVEFEPSKIEEVKTESENEVPVIPIDQVKKTIRPWRYAVAAALLPVAFYSFWIPMKTDVLESGILSIHDFNPFRKSVPAQYQPSSLTYTIPQKTDRADQLKNIPEDVTVFSFSIDDDRFVPVRVGNQGTVGSAKETEADTPTLVPQQKPQSGSYIVVGCFSDLSNAENLVKTLRSKGYDARVIGPGSNGLIRVSAGDGSQFSALQPKLKAEGLEGWVLK